MNFFKQILQYFHYSIPEEFLSLYDQHIHDLWVSRLNVAYLFCVVLIPCAFVFDILIFPNQWQQLLLVRIISTMVCIILFICSNKTLLKKYPAGMCHILNVVIASTIAYLTHLTGTHSSPYYAGLILIFIGIAMIVPWGTRGALTAGVVILVIHLSFNFFYDLFKNHPINWPAFWVSIYFLTFAFIMVIISSGMSEKINRRIFVSSEQEKIKNKKLEESRKKINELSRAKSHFLTNITHELKTPLSIVIGNTNIILEKSSRLSNGTKKQLQIIEQAAFQLSTHVDRIIAVSKMDDPGIQLVTDNYDYIGVVEQIFSLFKSRAQEEKRIYSLDLNAESLIARIDVVRIEEVLTNLIQNSFKFTEPGDTIKVTVGCDGHNIYTEVSNTGVGIPKNQLKKIFERLYQADEILSKRFGGTGIGLYLCKRNVELHGGTISAHSKVGKGTSFRFTLPLHIDQSVSVRNILSKEGERRVAARRKSGTDRRLKERRLSDRRQKFELQQRFGLDELAKMAYVEDIMGYEDRNPEYPSILLVEDNPGMLKVVVDAMRDAYNLYIARNSSEALEKLNKYGDNISLILSDILMPGMSGFDFCRKVMTNEDWKHIPLIFITALFKEEDQIKGFELGATDYITKPYNIRILKEKVAHWIARRQYEILLQNISASLESHAREISKMKDYIVHEIRNPLQLISGADYKLRKVIESHYNDSSEQEKKLREVLKMLQQGFRSIESVLATSRYLIKEELPSKRPEPIESLFDDALEQCTFLLEGITLQLDLQIKSGKSIYCSKKMLTQVFVNLIRNAAEAIGKKGPQHNGIIHIKSEQSDNKYFLIKIQDNGIGIPPEIQEKLFKFRFTTKRDGTGIGLHLSKMILGIHLGTITVESTEGVGSIFSIHLPIHNA